MPVVVGEWYRRQPGYSDCPQETSYCPWPYPFHQHHELISRTSPTTIQQCGIFQSRPGPPRFVHPIRQGVGLSYAYLYVNISMYKRYPLTNMQTYNMDVGSYAKARPVTQIDTAEMLYVPHNTRRRTRFVC